jgi:hypothetical protein
VLGSPWYIHNVLTYGKPLIIARWELTNARTGQPYQASELLLEGLLLLPTFWGLLWRSVVGLYQSSWVQVGWFRERLAMPLYALIGVWVAASVAGHLRLWLTHRRAGGRWWTLHPRPVWFYFLAWLMVYLNIMAISLFVHIGWYQGGRYLLPLVWGLTLFIGLGLDALAGRANAPVFVALAATMLGLNVVCLTNLITYLNPLHAPHWTPFT